MERSPNVVIGTAGHIDHGKTALVRALTGVDTDRLPAERQRGISIDIGFAALELPPYHASIVDVPGHERFIRNMLAGATGIDLALLVVAADDSVMPQTREHLQILEHLGITQGVVALSKADLADPGWLDLVTDDIRACVSGSFLADAPIVRVSSRLGTGIEELKASLRACCERLPEPADPGLFRMAIDRGFTVAGRGTVVTGTVASGEAALGAELQLWPEGRTVRIKGLQRHGEAVESVGRGTRAAVNLVGVHHAEIERGQELAAPGYLEPTTRLTAWLGVSPTAPRPVRHRHVYALHLGTRQVPAAVILPYGQELEPGARRLVQLVPDRPIVATSQQPYVLREESPAETLGGGTVLCPHADSIPRKQRTIAGIGELAARLADPLARLELALDRFRLPPPGLPALVRATGIRASQMENRLAELVAARRLVELPVAARQRVLISRRGLALLEAGVLRALGELHTARPRQSGFRLADIAGKTGSSVPELAIPAVLPGLAEQGRITAAGLLHALPDRGPRLSQAEHALKQQILAAIEAGAAAPPDLPELLQMAGARAGVVPDLLQLLAEEGKLVGIGGGFWLASAVEEQLCRSVRERMLEIRPAGLTMSGLREFLGTTRKYAVPIGEYLDRIGLTRRMGDVRILAQSNPVSGPTPDQAHDLTGSGGG